MCPDRIEFGRAKKYSPTAISMASWDFSVSPPSPEGLSGYGQLFGDFGRRKVGTPIYQNGHFGSAASVAHHDIRIRM